jgi:RNA polymerase sigma-70 factor (ECF subfamily)
MTMEQPDAPLAPQALLQHAGFVRALARRLLRDEHAAEDLEQEAWTRWLGARPDEGNVRGWFRAVLRNLALNRGRGEERRARRERASARAEAVESAEEEHAQAELLRAVVEAVLALDEPHRATILARFYQGLDTAEIARRTGASPGTVRSREHRALAKLRERLDRESGGRERWMAALARLAGRGAPAAAAVAATGSGLGLALVAAVVVIGAGALAWQAGSSSRSVREARIGTGGEAQPGAEAQRAALEMRPQTSATRAPASAGSPTLPENVTSASSAEIQGRLVYPDGSPAAGVPVTLAGRAGNSERVLRHGMPEGWTDLAVAADAQGRFTLRFEPHAAFQFQLAAKAPGHARVSWRRSEMRPGESVDLGDVALARGGTLEGRVVDAEGAPLSGTPCTVIARAPDPTWSGPFDPVWEHAVSDGDAGAFRFEDLPPGRLQLEADSPLTGAITGPVVQIRAGEVVTADVVHRGPAPARSIALSVGTRPFDLLEDSLEPASVRLIAPDGSTRAPSRSSGSDFFFDELTDGLHALEIDDPRFERWSETALAPGSSARARLVPSAALELDVRAADGERVESYAVRVELLELRSSARVIELHDGETPLAQNRVRVPPGELLVKVRARGSGASARVTLQPGETRAVALVLGGTTGLTGAVRHPDGVPAPGITVSLVRPAAEADSPASPFLPGVGAQVAGIFRSELDTTVTDAHGAFRFDLPAGGTFALRAALGDLLETSTDSFTVDDGEQASEHDLVLPRGGWVRVTVGASSAACLDSMQVWAGPAEVLPHQRFDLRRALARPIRGAEPIELGPLPPGLVRVHALLPDTHQRSKATSGSRVSGGRELAVLEVAEGATVEAQLVLDECPGDMTVEVRVDGSPAPGVSVTLVPVDPDECTRFEGVTDAEGRFGPVRAFPGEYTVHLSDRRAGWSFRHPTSVTCRPSAAVEVDLDVELVAGALVCTDAHGDALVAQQVTVLCLTDGGSSHVVTRRTDAGGRLELQLVPGEYGLQLGAYLPRRSEHVPFSWTASGPVPERVQL